VSKDTLDIFFNDDAGKEHYLKAANDVKATRLLYWGTENLYYGSLGPYYLCLPLL
jgi:hypothetical protein